ncbi:MAG: helix-turn-helix protein [Bacteroidota bacterium]|jgi:transcriptional regulator with XRE-family HTH domain
MEILTQMHWYIGPNLRRERDKKGIRQIPFAQMADMSQGNLSNIESNKQSVNWEQVQVFAKILGIPTERLTDEKNTLNIHIEQQSGSANGNNNVVNNTPSETTFKVQEERIAAQQEEITFLRSQLDSAFRQIEVLTKLLGE